MIYEIGRMHYRAMVSVFGRYEILKGLSFSASAGIDFSQGNKNLFTPSTMDEKYHENKSEGAISRTIALSTDELLEYDLTIKEKHKFNVLLGLNITKDQYFYIGGYGKNGASDNVYYYDPGKAPSIVDHGKNGNEQWVSTTTYSSDFSEKIMVSYFGRLGYNFKQRYLFETTFRRDGSFHFRRRKPLGKFPICCRGMGFFGRTFYEMGQLVELGKTPGKLRYFRADIYRCLSCSWFDAGFQGRV